MKDIAVPDFPACPAVITVSNWTMAPDGNVYLHFWCEDWRVVTDKAFPGVERFQSSEKWQLFAMTVDHEIAAVFPGCQVKSFIRCLQPPVDLPSTAHSAYALGREEV